MDTLHHAWSNSPFYRSRWPEAPPSEPAQARPYLASLPILEKEDLRAYLPEISASTDGRERTSLKTTGGSTGNAVTLRKNADAIAREMAASWLGYGWFSIKLGDKAARFWGSPGSTKRRLRFMAADIAMNRIRFSAFAFDEDDLRRYWTKCQVFRPVYFYGYVSMLTAFAEFIRRAGLPGRTLGLKAIVTTSEVLRLEDVELLGDVFGCPVQNEYGCGEVGPIAYSCPESGWLHQMTENVALEIMTPEGGLASAGESGELLVTDLNNCVTPIIRYRIGDRATRADGSCLCGRPFPALTKVWGRAYDFVTTPSDKRFHGEFFLYLFEELHSQGQGVGKFQVVQEDVDAIEIRLASPPSAGQVTFLKERIGRAMPDVQVAVIASDDVQRSQSGKVPLIISRIRTHEDNGTDATT